jgi:exopolysaccharide production protein ExoQ
MTLDAQTTAQPSKRQGAGPGNTEAVPGRVTAVFAAFGFALPLVAILASAGVVPLMLIATLLAALAVWSWQRRLPKPDRGLAIALGVLLAWCAAASLWGFEPARSLVLTLRIGAIFAAALLLHALAGKLDDQSRRRFGDWLVAGVVLGLGLMASEAALGFPLDRWLHDTPHTAGDPAVALNRGAVALAILCWPAAAFLRRRFGRTVSFALPPIVLLVLSFLSSLSAGAGLIAGAVTALVASLHPRAGRVVLVLATVGALVGSPLVAKQLYRLDWEDAGWLPHSAAHRVTIWNFAVQRIAEKPLAGWGFDAARYMKRVYPELAAKPLSPISLHPHNAVLQVLLELGVIGALVALGVAWTLIRRTDALPWPERVFAQATYVTILAISCTAFGIWQNKWLALIASAALAVALTRPDRPEEPGPTGTGAS